MHELEEKLQNAENKLSAAEQCKVMLTEEIETRQQTIESLTQSLAVSAGFSVIS